MFQWEWSPIQSWAAYEHYFFCRRNRWYFMAVNENAAETLRISIQHVKQLQIARCAIERRKTSTSLKPADHPHRWQSVQWWSQIKGITVFQNKSSSSIRHIFIWMGSLNLRVRKIRVIYQKEIQVTRRERTLFLWKLDQRCSHCE